MSSDSELLAADQRARRDALDVTRSFIVQAPAGSGKTELLIQRYLYLLGTVTEPEEVVAITFTRKAASEMQLRVINALRQARDGKEGKADHERLTLSAANRILQRDKELGWQLLESPRRLRIQTLDAFCASITRLLPVSSGLGGTLTTTADATMSRLYKEAARATLDWLADDTASRVVFERVLEHLDYNVGEYVSYLADMLAKRDQWLHFTGSGGIENDSAVRDALEHTIAVQISARLERLRRRFDALGGAEERRLLRYSGEQLALSTGESQLLAELDENAWPSADARNAPLWRAIAGQLLTGKAEIRKQVNVRTGFPAGDNGEKGAFHAWLKDLRAVAGLAEQLAGTRFLPDPHYREEQWQVLLALFKVLPVAVAELRRLFAERGVTDHVEVALAAGAALGTDDEPGDIALLLDYRIRHLLVDEMQDTSTGQYRLLARLTAGWEAGDGRTLFCVGDPMQSIYRFRDAAVGQFVTARANGIGELRMESLVLRQNFRSGEHLVTWFNRTFSDVLPDADDAATGAISYSPSVAVAAHADSGIVQCHPLIDASRQEEASCSADVIEQCLAQDAKGKVAVLVRSRTQLPLLLAELRRRAVGCQAIEIDRLTDLPEIIDLLALTRALCHAGDRIAWLGVLRAPWAGLSWSDLHALVRNDRHSSVPELFADKERLDRLSAHGRSRVLHLQTVLAKFARPHGARSLRERVEGAWMALGGPGALATAEQLENAYRFLAVLEKLEQGGTLGDVAALAQQLDDERVSSPGDEQTRVQVMTIHKAKGLQFDHVVLHGLGRTTGSGSRDVLAWLSVAAEEHGSDIIISPLAPRASLESDPLHRFIEQAAKESEQLEMGRLLYVACTRAVRSLQLVGAVKTMAHGTQLASPPQNSLLQRLWGVLEQDYAAAFARRTDYGEPVDDEEAVFVVPPGRRFAEPWQSPPLPAAPPLKAEAPPPGDREVDFYWVGSSARHAGTIVHRWLQKMADGTLACDRLPDGVEAVNRRWALNLGVPEQALSEVNARVLRALEAVTRDERARWLLSGTGHAELRLSGRFAGGIANIAIDRVRVEDGVHWLVDYKTSTHEGGDLEGFLRQESERYLPQLRRYRTIYGAFERDVTVRTALYFPLLQRFVEVDTSAAL